MEISSNPRGISPVEKIKVAATTGMIADIAQIIGGNIIKVTGLMGSGVDPHLYKATAGDLDTLSNAEIIFFSGLHLEAGLSKILEVVANGKAVTDDIPRDELLGDVQFVNQFDPHVWFDVEFWMEAVKTVNHTLGLYFPGYGPIFDANTRIYLEKLGALHEYVINRSQELPKAQRVLVTAHDAFRYFGKKYDFEVVGLQGISTVTEAGTADVSELADFILERQIRAIFVESSVPQRTIEAVIEACADRGWVVNIGGSLFSDAMGDSGTFEGTYIGMVTHNIDTIVDALSG